MSFDFLGIPSLAVNGYLWKTMQRFYDANKEEEDPSLDKVYEGKLPFYPVGDSAAGDEPWDNKPYFVYDRVFRFSSQPFYEHKRESTLYYLKAREKDSLEWAAIVQLILDREDDSAKDINAWIRDQWYKKIIDQATEDGSISEGQSLNELEMSILLDCYKSGERYEDFGYNLGEKIVRNEHPVYFHNLRVYQSRSSSPSSEGKLRDLSTVQPYYITEFMIDTHFHFTENFDNYLERFFSEPETS
jgi:hypothetical protein